MSQHLTATQATRKKRFSDELRFVIGVTALVTLGLTFTLTVIRPLGEAYGQAYAASQQEAVANEMQQLSLAHNAQVPIAIGGLSKRTWLGITRETELSVTYLTPSGSLIPATLPLDKTTFVFVNASTAKASLVFDDWTPWKRQPLQYNIDAHLVSATVYLTQAQYDVLAAKG